MATSMRVLCWNVHGLRGDVSALTGVVREADPDVFCVQEAPKYLRWRTRCAGLARECGLVYVAGGGRTGGTALFVNLRVDVRRRLEVALSRSWLWPDRGLAAAVVRRADAEITVASLHLPLDAPQRASQVRQILDLIASAGTEAPLVAAGDLNERPGGSTWQALSAAGLIDPAPGSGPTFPAHGPRKRIDALLVGDRITVEGYQVLDGPEVSRGSDHRPLLATLTLPDA